METGGDGRRNRGWANAQAMRNGQNKRMRGRNRKSHNPLTRVYRIERTGCQNPRHSLARCREICPTCARRAVFGRSGRGGELFPARRTLSSPDRLGPGAIPADSPSFRGDGGADMRDDVGDDGEEEHERPRRERRAALLRHPRSPALSAARRAVLFAARAAELSDENSRTSQGEQQNFPREQNPARESQSYTRDQSSFQREQREQPNFTPRLPPSQSPQAPRKTAMSSGCHRSSPAAPAPSSPPAQPNQGYGQNGFEGQGDRFPLHRRRRRHRGPPPRADMAQGGSGASEGDDAPQGPRSGSD